MKNEFVFVRCGDKATAMELKVTSTPSLIFFYPGGEEEIVRLPVADAAGVERAMNQALKTYSAKTIDWKEYSADLVEEARAGEKLVVVAFADDRKDSQATLTVLEDRAIARYHDKILFLKVAFSKDGHAEKAWEVWNAPAILVIDPRQEIGRKAVVDKILGKKNWRTYANSLQKGFRLLEKPLP